MIRHYLRSFFRRLRRSPLTGALRIGGLAVGLAACFLIGRYVQHDLQPLTAIHISSGLGGDVRDFHTGGLRHPIGPTALYPESRLYRHLIVRLESGGSETLESTLGNLEERWSSLAPTYPFDPTFFVRHLRSLYQDERRLRGAVTAGSGLAVLLACLGLFGLAAWF